MTLEIGEGSTFTCTPSECEDPTPPYPFPDGRQMEVAVDYGDGSPTGRIRWNNQGKANIFTHTYTIPGKYQVNAWSE